MKRDLLGNVLYFQIDVAPHVVKLINKLDNLKIDVWKEERNNLKKRLENISVKYRQNKICINLNKLNNIFDYLNDEDKKALNLKNINIIRGTLDKNINFIEELLKAKTKDISIFNIFEQILIDLKELKNTLEEIEILI